MRTTERRERVQRGCKYCTHAHVTQKSVQCPFDSCPYTETNGFDNYEKYFEQSEQEVETWLKSKKL